MFPRQMVLWIMSNLDWKRGGIKLRNGEPLPFSEEDVELVLEIQNKESNEVHVGLKLFYDPHKVSSFLSGC